MTKEAKRIVAALRVVCDERSCEGCPCSDWCHKRKVNCLDVDAADLIESLSAQLEQVTRERDAAVKDLGDVCRMIGVCCCCKNQDGEYDSNDCMDCIHGCNWQWRGVEVDSDA